MNQVGFRSAQKGQSLVEFAFLLLPFLIASIAVIELGRAWTIKQAITNAAREGARVLILPYGNDRICPDIDCSSAASVGVAAIETSLKFLDNSGVSIAPQFTEVILVRHRVIAGGTVVTEPLNSDPVAGEYVGVMVKFRFTSVVQALLTGTEDLVTMTGVSVMRHE